jgi:uncharacterized membrane protein YheB (UPF0754 family)
MTPWTILIEIGKGALTGAIIGYVTNWLAVWMLFHPRREYRLFGRPIPLTPGLVVKNQERLADAIGKSVARDLLDSQTVLRHLEEINLAEPIEKLLHEERGVLQKSPRTLAEHLGTEHAAALEQAHRNLSAMLTTKILDLATRLESDSDFLRGPLHQLLSDLANRRLDSYLTTAQLAALREWLLGQARSLAAHPRTDALLNASVEKALREFPGTVPFRELQELLIGLIREKIPAASLALQQGLGAWLASDHFAEQAQSRLAIKLHSMIVGRFPMAAMLISEKMIRELLTQRWQDIAADLQQIVLDPTLTDYLNARLNETATNSVASIEELFRREDTLARLLPAITGQLRAAFEHLLNDQATAEALDAKLRELAGQPIVGIIPGLDAKVEQLALEGSRHLAGWIRSENGSNWIASKTSALLSHLVYTVPLGRLVGALPEREWDAASHALAGIIHQRTLRILPTILSDHVNLADIVKQRILGFDTGKLEEIIYRVSDRELKGIVRFGGILGVIVGALSSLIDLYFR